MMRALTSDGHVYVSVYDLTTSLRGIATTYAQAAAAMCCEGHGDPYAQVSDEMAMISDRLDCLALELKASQDVP